MLRIFHKTHYNFLGWWRHMAAVTAAFMLAGLAMAVVRPLQYSIEFTGGTMLHVRFAQPVSPGDIRSALLGAGIGADIQTFGAINEFTIRAQEREQIAEQEEGAESVSRDIENTLAERFGGDAFEVIRTEAIGPRVGEELRRNAAYAILISFVVTMIYLAIRFEWRFGVAAVVATAHDVMTTIAFLLLMNIEVSLTVVAAILTVIGYSLNDTIIIFDRVRENLRKKRKESMKETLNRSINETLPRAILTHGTTLAATMALLIFAGPVIRPFAWVMFFGILTGTFSSMFVASPLLLWIERKWPRDMGAKGGGGPRSRAGEERPRQRPAQPVATR
ncbi:MAG TPA: protein translocase subunit SecF [Gemmatimonadaceae bacterium]|nr:protein translocase subunit SecF [Gemmatimonadaceae bacterium]